MTKEICWLHKNFAIKFDNELELTKVYKAINSTKKNGSKFPQILIMIWEQKKRK